MRQSIAMPAAQSPPHRRKRRPKTWFAYGTLRDLVVSRCIEHEHCPGAIQLPGWLGRGAAAVGRDHGSFPLTCITPYMRGSQLMLDIPTSETRDAPAVPAEDQ